MLPTFAALAAQGRCFEHSDGLTCREIVADLPHDPASIVVLAISAAAIAWVIWAGRSRNTGGPGADKPS